MSSTGQHIHTAFSKRPTDRGDHTPVAAAEDAISNGSVTFKDHAILDLDKLTTNFRFLCLYWLVITTISLCGMILLDDPWALGTLQQWITGFFVFATVGALIFLLFQCYLWHAESEGPIQVVEDARWLQARSERVNKRGRKWNKKNRVGPRYEDEDRLTAGQRVEMRVKQMKGDFFS